ncbi:MAG TPA: hypothetical protein VFT19_05285 [Solirubrobacterales bacterium]|nr:hypothetical protein [Solirubrobacterales bacterium]
MTDLDPGSARPVDADREMTRSLRTQMAERERNRQQVGLLSGGTIAAAASVMSQASVANLLVLGLSILLLAFAFTMLNFDYRVVVAAEFIIARGEDDASVQLAWERHLHRGSKRVRMPPVERAARWMRVSASYAVPVLGALGTLAVFVYQGSGLELFAATIPAVLTLLFLSGARDLSNRYVLLVK